MAESHLDQLARVYSPLTWDVYAELDVSLDPRGPDVLLQRAAEFLVPGSTVLDAGCRDAAHLIRLVRGRAVTGIGIDPVARHVQRARSAIDSAGLRSQISIRQHTMEEAPSLGSEFDLIWCRDVLEQVADLTGALRGVAEVLKPRGRMIVFTTTSTELLQPGDSSLLNHHLGNVAANLVEANLEAAFAVAGLEVEDRDVIGTEWREHAEERTHPVSIALLRLARLRRTRESAVARHGTEVYQHVEANLHWELFQFLGKLRPTVYVLRRESPKPAAGAG